MSQWSIANDPDPGGRHQPRYRGVLLRIGVEPTIRSPPSIHNQEPQSRFKTCQKHCHAAEMAAPNRLLPLFLSCLSGWDVGPACARISSTHLMGHL